VSANEKVELDDTMHDPIRGPGQATQSRAPDKVIETQRDLHRDITEESRSTKVRSQAYGEDRKPLQPLRNS